MAQIIVTDPKVTHRTYAWFLGRVKTAEVAGDTQLLVDLSRPRFFYPDGMAPLVAAISRLKEAGWRIHVVLPEDDQMEEYFESVGWLAGIDGEEAPEARIGATYVPLCRYGDSARLNAFINQALDLLSKTAVFPSGTFSALEWSVNEIADNVLVHAGDRPSGWMQLTSYPQKGEVEFVVVDTGRGVLASLKEAYPNLSNDEDALRLAVQKGITRNREYGQGNGLSGALNIAQAAKGWLNLHSGSGLLRWAETEIQSRRIAHHVGTVVTMTLPVKEPIDLTTALWGKAPLPAFETSHLSDEGVVFTVNNEASGFGNRATGQFLRTRLQNIMEEFPDERVVIDFHDIDLVSASFADEFVAKLVNAMGPIQFFGRVQLRNMSNFISRSVDEVIKQRLGSGG